MKSKLELRKEKYLAQLKELGLPLNKKLFEEIVQGLGPANHKVDAMFVASSDPKELERVYKNFVLKKLGVKDEKKAWKAIEYTKEKMAGKRKKYRAVFYYILAKKLGFK